MATTATRFAGIELTSWTFNASGPIDTTLEELCAIAESGSPAVSQKTHSVPPRIGNPEPRLYIDEERKLSQQAIGLANEGIVASRKNAQEIATRYGTKVIESIAAPGEGDNLLVDDWHLLMTEAQACEHTCAVTINISCPSNGDPIAYDLARTRAVLDATTRVQRRKPVGIKVPQFVVSREFDGMAKLVLEYDIDYLVTTNSIVRTVRFDLSTRRPVIGAHRGFAGLGGDPILDIAVGQVVMFYERLKTTRVDIIGVGGILPGNHGAIQHVLAGARAGKIGTGMLLYGPACIGQVDVELATDLDMMGFASVTEAIGCGVD
jgi:dihydroorotate dehydrogenase